MADIWYVDSSALVKFFVDEAETEALRLATRDLALASSEIALVEVPRAMTSLGFQAVDAPSLAQFDFVPFGQRVIELAIGLQPPTLRSLDAIHVASALSLGSDCEGMITYDRRMREAARHAGLTVESPGATAS